MNKCLAVNTHTVSGSWVSCHHRVEGPSNGLVHQCEIPKLKRKHEMMRSFTHSMHEYEFLM